MKLVIAKNQAEAMQFFTSKVEESSSVQLRSQISNLDLNMGTDMKRV